MSVICYDSFMARVNLHTFCFFGGCFALAGKFSSSRDQTCGLIGAEDCVPFTLSVSFEKFSHQAENLPEGGTPCGSYYSTGKRCQTVACSLRVQGGSGILFGSVPTPSDFLQRNPYMPGEKFRGEKALFGERDVLCHKRLVLV